MMITQRVKMYIMCIKINVLTMRLGSICNKKGQSRLHAGDLALLCYILQ
jgi:hypothetical protein